MVLRFFGEISSNGCRPPVTAAVSWQSATVGGCRVQQSPVEELNRLRETNSQWEEIPISNGPRKKWIFEDISTNWQWYKFIFVGGSSMPWWNWEMIQRKSRKIIQWLVKNRQTRVFTTFEQASSSSRPVTEVVYLYWLVLKVMYSDNLFWHWPLDPQTPLPLGRGIPPPRTPSPSAPLPLGAAWRLDAHAFHGQLPQMSSDPRNAPDCWLKIRQGE